MTRLAVGRLRRVRRECTIAPPGVACRIVRDPSECAAHGERRCRVGYLPLPKRELRVVVPSTIRWQRGMRGPVRNSVPAQTDLPGRDAKCRAVVPVGLGANQPGLIDSLSSTLGAQQREALGEPDVEPKPSDRTRLTEAAGASGDCV